MDIQYKTSFANGQRDEEAPQTDDAAAAARLIRDEEHVGHKQEAWHQPCPTEQQLKAADAVITIRGYRRRSLFIVILVWLLIIFTCGILGVIILYWKPAWFLKMTHTPCSLAVADMIYIKDAYRQNFVRRMFTTTATTLPSLQQKHHHANVGSQSLTVNAAANANDDDGVLPASGEQIQLLNDQGVVENHDKLRWFHFQKRNYWFDPRINMFVPLVGPTSFRRSDIDPKCGLSDADARQRYQLYGKNEITIRVYSYARTLVLEALNPFYFFQAFSVTVWLFDGYFIFSCCLLLMSCMSLGYTTWQTRRMQQMRHERFESSGTVLAIRHNNNNSMAHQAAVKQEMSSSAASSLARPRAQSNSNVMQTSSQTLTHTDSSHQTLNNESSTSCLTIDKSIDRHVNIISEEEEEDPIANGGHLLVSNNKNLNYAAADRRSAASRRSTSTYRRRLSSRMYAGSHVRSIDSKDLVPGDIILIPQQGCEMYCDAVILNGACIVNESTLTGESVPVTKMASVDDDDEDCAEADEEESVQEEESAHESESADVVVEDVHHFSSERLVYVAPNTAATTRTSDKNNKIGATSSGTASSKSVLYAGTHVIQTRYYGNEPVKAVVMRTGFATVKGELVRSVLYPKPVDFLFYMEAYKFLGFLSALASVGLVYSLFILLWRSRSLQGAVIRSLGLITTVVPPTLPLALTLGIVYAQKRLKRAGLFCISPRMINMAGSINVVCFDKTGTLTEEGLNLRGVVPVHDIFDNDDAVTSNNSSRRRLSALIADNALTSNTITKNITQLCKCMATCHALTLIDGKLCGDPLDLEMFRATGWQLDEPDMDVEERDGTAAATKNAHQQLRPTVVRPAAATGDDRKSRNDEISIVRILPFESHLQRMSVLVVERERDVAGFYCKGSPEMIASLCDSKTVPENFAEVLSQYTQQGHRVLALARRTFSNTTEKQNDGSNSLSSLQRARRSKLECNLEFLGLLVFENRLKPETIECIRELKSALIRPVMITGDNLLTAISVGRQCGIIDTDEVLLYEASKTAASAEKNSPAKLRKTVMSTITPTTNSAKKRRKFSPNEMDVEATPFSSALSCALTGDVFTILRAKNAANNSEYTNTILRRGAIFARMSPSQKEALVEDLRHAGGYFVGMCGDGANDCGALRTAHMGISLSDQEASAAAPFTYKHANVSCVPTCIREGRAALDTSFGAFKYMAAYSLTQFFSVLLLYWLNTNLGAYEFLYIDLFEVTLIICVFGATNAYSRLVRTPPPTRLLAFGPLSSLLGQVALVLTFQTTAYFLVQQQSWYANIVSKNAGYNAGGSHNDESYFSYENYAVYSVSQFQYIWLAIAFSRGFPYRKSIFTNWRLVALCVALVVFDIYVVVMPCSWIVRMFELALPPGYTFRWILVCIALTHFCAAIMLEWWFLAWLNKQRDRKRQRPPAANKSLNGNNVELDSLPLALPGANAV